MQEPLIRGGVRHTDEGRLAGHEEINRARIEEKTPSPKGRRTAAVALLLCRSSCGCIAARKGCDDRDD